MLLCKGIPRQTKCRLIPSLRNFCSTPLARATENLSHTSFFQNTQQWGKIHQDLMNAERTSPDSSTGFAGLNVPYSTQSCRFAYLTQWRLAAFCPKSKRRHGSTPCRASVIFRCILFRGTPAHAHCNNTNRWSTLLTKFLTPCALWLTVVPSVRVFTQIPPWYLTRHHSS